MIRPQDLPEIRADVVTYQLTMGPTLFDFCIREGLMPVETTGSTHEAATVLAQAEAERVHRADLYWVDDAMTELALAAGRTLPEFTLAPEDLPSRHGLMVFSQPLSHQETPRGTTCVTAVAWGPWPASLIEQAPPTFREQGGVWLSWYSDRDRNQTDEQTASILRRTQPRLTYDNETQLPFSSEPVGAIKIVDGKPSDGKGSYPYCVVKAAWLLMQQPLANVREVEADRAARKRLRRNGQPVKPVRLIELRRPKRTADANGDSGREYQHQWIVRGHWRQQWYPAREVHRPVWIAPHIKGPEGAPLLGGEKVHVLRRHEGDA